MRITISAVLVLAGIAGAQTTIDPNHKFAWTENCGYLNWRDGGAQGVLVGAAGLSGFIWSENTGWINTGVSGGPYANTNESNFGVNRGAGGELSGMAWGENVGWINFGGGALATPPNPARVDAGRLRGFAWGENIGWVNLDDAGVYVGLGTLCYANCDQSTSEPILNVQDFICFLNKFQAGDSYANCDSSTTPPVLNIQDFGCFMNKFAAGCS